MLLRLYPGVLIHDKVPQFEPVQIVPAGCVNVIAESVPPAKQSAVRVFLMAIFLLPKVPAFLRNAKVLYA